MPLDPRGTVAGLADADADADAEAEAEAGGSVKLSSPGDELPVADSSGSGGGIAVSEIDPGSGGAPCAPDVASAADVGGAPRVPDVASATDA